MEPWRPPNEFDGFQIRELLGQGGMGRVYLGHELSLDRTVALKFIAAEDPGPDARLRFVQEARAIARLQHPNIVAIYRIGEDDRRPYIAYEYVNGKSLDRVFTPVPWTRALEIGLAVARGLALAHQRGVLHRDVKPANIIVTAEGTIKLVDFGLAKLLVDQGSEPPSATAGALSVERWLREHSHEIETADTQQPSRTLQARARLGTLRDAGTQEETLVGTPNYIAPEVWRGGRASSRSDVYALGLVLFELCSGQLPFAGLTGEVLMDRVLTHALPPVASVCPDLPRSLATIIDRCAALDPAQRYADGGELLGALENVESVLRGFQKLGKGARLDDAGLVSGCLSRVQTRADALFSAFYQRLFARSPELKALFPTSMAVQEMMLASALRFAVDNLSAPDKLVPMLEDLGARHALYGVKPDQFAIFQEALIDTLREFDAEAWDPVLERAWRRAFGAVSAALWRGLLSAAQRRMA